MPNRGLRLRVNATLVGDYVRDWQAEKQRGGSDGMVLMRLIDASKSRSLREMRHDLYNDLNAIAMAAATQRLKNNQGLREEIALIESMVTTIRAKLARVNGV